MIKKFIHNCGALASSYWQSYTTKGKIWLILAMVAVVVDAKLCYEYGVTQTTWHGVGFAVVALFFSQLPDGAYEEFEKGNKTSGVLLALLCIPLGAVAYQSHIGFGAGVRMGDIKKANLQQARYDDGRDSVGELKSKVKLFEDTAKRLDADMAKLVDMKVGADGWTVTTAPASPEALDGQIAAKQLEVANESKRNGCKSKCEARTNELAHLQALRATAVKIAENQAQHAATIEALAKTRGKSEMTDAGMSSVAMQTEANTQLFGVLRAAYTGEPLEAAMKTTEQSSRLANLLITALGSLAFMLMAPIGFFMANRNKRRELNGGASEYRQDYAAGSSSARPANYDQPKLPPHQHTHTREIVKMDSGFAARALAEIDSPKVRDCIDRLRGFKLA